MAFAFSLPAIAMAAQAPPRRAAQEAAWVPSCCGMPWQQAIDQAESLDDLRVPPGNRLEALRGDRLGQHSMRINDQYRICFVWADAGADDVEVVDDH